MVKVATASLLLAALSVSANPLIYRRQDASSSAASGVESASSALSSVVGSASSAAGGSSVASASASASASATSQYPGYPCPQGLLTYVIARQEYPGVSLEAAVNFLSDWAKAVPYPLVNSTGTNETGATRTYTVQGLNVSEVLVNQTIDATTGALHSDWNLTSPISTAGLTVYTAADHLDYYSNSTTGVSTAQLYSNFCSSDQAAGVAAFTQLFQGTLAAFGQLLSGSASSGASSGAASSAAASSAASGAASSAQSALSSASGALSSASASASA